MNLDRKMTIAVGLMALVYWAIQPDAAKTIRGIKAAIQKRYAEIQEPISAWENEGGYCP